MYYIFILNLICVPAVENYKSPIELDSCKVRLPSEQYEGCVYDKIF